MSRKKIKLNIKKLIFFSNFIILIVFSSNLLFTSHVKAAMWPNGALAAFVLPPDIYTYFNNSDSGTRSPTYASWISAADDSLNRNSVSVKAGDKSVGLWFNSAGIVNIPSQGDNQNIKIKSVTANSGTITDLTAGQTIFLNLSAGYGAFDWQHESLTLNAPSGGFVNNTSYTVSVTYKEINGFHVGFANQSFLCAQDGGGGSPTSDMNTFAPCPEMTVSYTISVQVVPVLNYPWLQSLGGDVSSQGGVSGQLIGKQGSRLANNLSKEAQFVVTSETQTNATLNSNFCSTNLLVLGVNAAGRKNCNTGGYKSSPIAFDSIYVSIKNAWESNGSGDSVKGKYCSPYGTSSVDAYSATSDFKTDISLGCPAGGIQLVGTDSGHFYSYLLNIPSGKTIKGNGTLLVIGNLYIISDIINSTINTNNPYDVPNLTIFVTGNVIVSPLVKELDASIIRYAPPPASVTDNNGFSIFTCKGGTACATNQLNVKGYMASSSNIVFNRRYTDASNNPAEIIKLTGQSIAFPSPGIDRSSSNSVTPDSLQINADELPPRLN